MVKRKNYSQEDLNNAIEYIKSGSSIRDASRRYKVPNSTLRWRLSKVPRKPGPAPFLNPTDEKQLSDYVKYQASKGAPVTTTWLLETAARLMQYRYLTIS